MNLPLPVFLQQLKEKQIYFFNEAPNMDFVPQHLHICIKHNNDILYFVCCTTKRDTILRFLDKQGIAYSTIVWLEPDKDNALTQDTYINCNNIRKCSPNDFANYYQNGKIQYIGVIKDSQYEQIINGILQSPLVEKQIQDSIQNILN